MIGIGSADQFSTRTVIKWIGKAAAGRRKVRPFAIIEKTRDARETSVQGSHERTEYSPVRTSSLRRLRVNSVVALLLDLRFRPKAAYTRLVLRDLGLMHGTPCFDQATHTQPINSLRTMASMTSMPAWLSFRAGR